MRVARVVAERGTCTRLQVGAVLTRDGRIVATGWNGAPAGLPHCDPDPVRHGTETRCADAIHAERNVIGFAARHGVRTDATTLYCTHAPCADCSTVLVAAGVVRVVYGRQYRSDAGVLVLQRAGVRVDQVPDDCRLTY